MMVGRGREGEARLEGARDLVVAKKDSPPILLRQVASVEFAAAVKEGDAGFLGKPAVILRVQKQPGVNTLQVTEDVKRVLRELKPYVPPSMHIDNVVVEQATFINTSIHNLA